MLVEKLNSYLTLARPHQWSKNLIVFAPLLFSEQWSLQAASTLVVVFAIFAILSSAIYSFNDALDKNRDILHPSKAKRPIAAGKISTREGILIALAGVVISILWSSALNLQLTQILIAYTVLAICYSALLKQLPYLDIATIAFLLLLRLYAGAIAVAVTPSTWIIIATLTLGLLLASGKRYIELVNHPDISQSTRPVLRHYQPHTLKYLILLLTASALGIYCGWCLEFQQTRAENHATVWLSLIPVTIAVTRYLYLLLNVKFPEDPIQGIFNDKVLCSMAIAFVAFHSWLLYVD